MERKTERLTKSAIFIAGALILLYTLSTADMRPAMWTAGRPGGGGPVNDQTKRTSGELVNTRPSHQSRNSGKTDKLEKTRITNSLRLRHLDRACKEVRK